MNNKIYYLTPLQILNYGIRGQQLFIWSLRKFPSFRLELLYSILTICIISGFLFFIDYIVNDNDLAEKLLKCYPLLALLSDTQEPLEVKCVYNHPIQERQKIFTDTKGRSGIYC